MPKNEDFTVDIRPLNPTREDVEKLKADWLQDPCWDISDTEGFESYFSELYLFQQVHSLKSEMLHMEKCIKKAEELRCSYETAKYLLDMESKIDKILIK